MRPPDPTQVFETHRPRLVRLAYRMIGSMAEAEDLVQDAWLRWARLAPGEAREPLAWLTRVVTRLCLDHLKSARARRETYVGAWLPEPLIDAIGSAQEPMADDLTLTLMIALERLSPLERAAFLLHDVFGIGYEEVAQTLTRDAGAVRQLAARARKHVQQARPRYRLSREEGDRIAQAFFRASQEGDAEALGALLASDAALYSDGGGKVAAFHNPIRGLPRLRRLYSSLHRKFGRESFQHLQSVWINGLPGYVSLERGEVLQTTALDIREGRIVAIYVTRNPDKLAGVRRLIGRPDPAEPIAASAPPGAS